MPAAELRGLAAAVAFLTRIPVGRWIELDAADVARGGALFPIVGAAIGAAVGGVTQSLAGPITPLLAAVLGLTAGAVLTGALHLDALADSADAFGASTRERALDIMRDHAIGAYGAVALVLDLGAKAAALAVLAERHDALRFAVCAAAVARVVPVLLASALPYARLGEGTGNALGATGWARATLAAAIGVGICILLHAVLLLAVAAAAVIGLGLVARRALGGITGDVLGGAAEVCEVTALVVAVALT